MKKTLTILAAAMLIASSGIAQMAKLQRLGESQARLSASNPKFMKSMRLSSSLNTKDLTSPIWQDTMSYCLDEEFYTGVGTQTAGDTVYWAVMFEASSLVGRNNLTDVQFYIPNGGAGVYSLSIYSGIDPTGTALFNQTVTVAASDTLTWKTVHFTTPVAITQGQPLWVVLQNSDVAYPAAAVAPNSYDNGKWVSLDGVQWMSVADAGVDATWMIRAISDTYTVLPPAVDLAGPQIALLGSPVSFTATSPNTDSWAWSVDGNDASQSTNTLNYTFTTAGNHTVTVTATNTAGSATESIVVNVVDCSNAISSFPYNENFEEDNPCWLFVSADPANDDRTGVLPYEEALQGSSVFTFSSYNDANDYNQFLISPELSLDNTSDYIVKFWYRGYRSTDSFRLLASTTTNDTSAFTTVIADLPTVATEWTEVAYQLPAGTKHFAIDYYGNYQYFLYVDSLTIEEMGAPLLTLTGDTTVGTGNEAHFAASASLAQTINWYVDGVQDATTGETFSHIFTTVGNHTVTARATNTHGYTEDSIIVNVFSCDDITIPYTPNFANGLGCWTSVSDSTEGFGWYTSAEMMQNPEGQVLSISAQNSFFGLYDVPVDNWLISPVITMPATGAYEIGWTVKPIEPTYAGDHYGVYVIVGNQQTLLFEETLNSSMTTFEERIAALPTTITGEFRVAFRHFNSMGGYALILGDIQLRTLSPAIVRLQGPTTVETNTPATFTAISSNADSYSWSVDGTAINQTGNVLTHTFSAAGNHTVTVTATNTIGSNNASLDVNAFSCDAVNAPYSQDFENPETFGCIRFVDADGDGYNWNLDFLRGYTDDNGYPNPQGHNGSDGMAGSASWYNQAVLTPDNWMMLPPIALPEGSNWNLSWYEKGQDVEYFAEHYSVYVSTTGREVSDFTTAAYSGNTTNDWIGRNVDLSGYAGQTVYIAFRHHNCSDMFFLDIDDIKVNTERVGINEVESSILAVSPNPASAMVSISADGIEGQVTVQIVDLNGRVMMQQQGNAQSFRFDVSTLAQGAYFVRLTGENVNAVSKLIVK